MLSFKMLIIDRGQRSWTGCWSWKLCWLPLQLAFSVLALTWCFGYYKIKDLKKNFKLKFNPRFPVIFQNTCSRISKLFSPKFCPRIRMLIYWRKLFPNTLFFQNYSNFFLRMHRFLEISSMHTLCLLCLHYSVACIVIYSYTSSIEVN